MKVKLNDLVEGIDFYSDEAQSFLHLKTGEVYIVTDEAIRYAENNDSNFPDWQKDAVKIAKDYLKNENDYLSLPSQHDVNEYQIMEDFASNLDDEKANNQLFICLRGKGAFRRFKDCVIMLGLDKEWYQFREEKYKEFVIEWCKENAIILEDEE